MRHCWAMDTTTAIATPSQKTLDKYGLTASEWLAILERQGGVCAVCEKAPSTGRLCIDHEHVKGWKKMPPEERKTYCRGLLCFWCNKSYVGRAITIEKAQNVVVYLSDYKVRKAESAARLEANKLIFAVRHPK